ncbi:PilZ domain-containing protein [Rhodanobacter sp. DHB23]|uniref:PilZ domain-containing protein n=1 Tax=Rhodanobacter sp. DHB23 TaxID=2775923 RepID=UPI001780B033|nr:PilZ domain-containing protein [Rhodanobacter sp. DHB23]MBD8871250.1 PilZ domain-containing protein [Rhodanobacter sp. DHB23]
MTASSWEEFEQRLSSEEILHVDCVPLAWPPSPEQLQRLAERNANTLATLDALEERRLDLGDDDNPLMQEMLRMDAKLTALVEIVNQMLAPGASLPSRQALRFNAIGAVLPSALLPSGEGLLLRLRFDACRSLPLELAGRPSRKIDESRSYVEFVKQNDATSDAIERLVFRHHRRKVAGARQQLG